MIEPRIISTIENRNSLFMKFEKQHDAERVKVELTKDRYEVNYSKSYTFICVTEYSDQSPKSHEENETEKCLHPRIEAPKDMEIEYDSDILELDYQEDLSELEGNGGEKMPNNSLEIEVKRAIYSRDFIQQRDIIEHRIENGKYAYQLALIPEQENEKKMNQPIILLPHIEFS
ncbi:hypothetical protein PVAND_013696 [Polypedilum vanderplanki]|uniref:Uncharacterized protein n=1 Tax=Polypedilum vanderplanki TaxID=319348 RepID=A0A9J6CS54_POLVA|nr:hypothetical protein PVAND_013696 [Polypedilum vanderplanki]